MQAYMYGDESDALYRKLMSLELPSPAAKKQLDGGASA